MNREKRETREKVLFFDECCVIQGDVCLYKEMGCGFLDRRNEKMNREKRETREKVLFFDECCVIQGDVFFCIKRWGVAS